MWISRAFKTYLDVTEDCRDPECLKTDFTLLRSVSVCVWGVCVMGWVGDGGKGWGTSAGDRWEGLCQLPLSRAECRVEWGAFDDEWGACDVDQQGIKNVPEIDCRLSGS